MSKWEYLKANANRNLNKYGKYDRKKASINPSVPEQIIFRRTVPNSPTQEVQKLAQTHTQT